MHSIPDELLKIKWLPAWHNPHVLDFIRTGSASALQKIQSLPDDGYWVAGTLPPPSQWNQEASRVLQLAVTHGLRQLVTSWLRRFSGYGTENWDEFLAALPILRSGGVPEDWIERGIGESALFSPATMSPTPAGMILLTYSDDQLTRALGQGWYHFALVLASQDPPRLKRLLAGAWEPLIKKSHWGSTLQWHHIVRINPGEFHELARTAYADQPNDAAHVVWALAETKPALYRDWAIEELTKICRANPDHWPARDAIYGLLKLEAPGAASLIEEWMPTAGPRNHPELVHLRNQIVKYCQEHYPHLAGMAIEAMTRSHAGWLVLEGIKEWKKTGVGDHLDQCRTALASVFRDQDPDCVVAGIKEAAILDLPGMAPDLWPLLEHKSAPVRSSAARALSGLAFAAAREKGVRLLHSKKADVRLTAVTLFQRMGGTEAMTVLKDRLDVEESDPVRDAILQALDAAEGVTVTPEERASRMTKTLAKAKGSPVKWLQPEALHLERRDGTTLTSDEVLYLLLRQSRCPEMRADIEARPLIASLDRKACAPAALQMLEGFLGSSQDAGDRWMITLSALCGDDRLVPLLSKAIVSWADNARGKLAEFAAGALALLGTDPALTVLESLTVRFRSKNKNIGEAASAAFAAAAEARGVTVEELGDIVVPWMGFEPGVRRLIQAGTHTWEMWVGPDFKPVYKDQATGKKLHKLPAAAGAAIQEEQKILTANLKEAAKAQLLRMESLLVRQFHWPVERWRALYPVHPLLRVFTSQLIWQFHPAGSGEATAFRALDDGGLTTVADSTFTLPDTGSISLVHPLNLKPEEKNAWETHLADYSVLPPFPQLRRPVFLCPDTERDSRFIKEVTGTTVNAMTFRGRAEKLGWVRSSVCDAGMVSAYRKIFSGTGVEAFLGLDGMYVGIGVEDSITLGQTCFVKSGAVKVGSYIYDDPTQEDDVRILPLGTVPAVAYSEVVADLYKISGKEQPAAETPAA